MPISLTGLFTTAPATRTVPPDAGSRPLIRRTRVLVPQPLGPTIASVSPDPIVNETGPTASTSPSGLGYVLYTLCSTTAVMRISARSNLEWSGGGAARGDQLGRR